MSNTIFAINANKERTNIAKTIQYHVRYYYMPVIVCNIFHNEYECATADR